MQKSGYVRLTVAMVTHQKCCLCHVSRQGLQSHTCWACPVCSACCSQQHWWGHCQWGRSVGPRCHTSQHDTPPQARDRKRRKPLIAFHRPTKLLCSTLHCSHLDLPHLHPPYLPPSHTTPSPLTSSYIPQLSSLWANELT